MDLQQLLADAAAPGAQSRFRWESLKEACNSFRLSCDELTALADERLAEIDGEVSP